MNLAATLRKVAVYALTFHDLAPGARDARFVTREVTKCGLILPVTMTEAEAVAAGNIRCRWCWPPPPAPKGRR